MVNGQWSDEAADRLPPQPYVRGDPGIGAARHEFFLEIADNELAPRGGDPLRQQPDREAGSVPTHLAAKRASRPAAIAVNA